MCRNQWHLGQQAKFLPTSHGFDEYLGIPFSADMGTSYWHPAGQGSVFQPTPLPLLNGTAEDGCTIIEQPAGLHTLAQVNSSEHSCPDRYD